jgi:transcriptional regulator with XRE-family HTH domain
MIISEDRDRYDGSFRLVLYSADSTGQCRAETRKSEMDDQIDSFYAQRQVEFERLKHQMLRGEISPIGFCLTYQNMTAADLAARMGLSRRQVKRHLRPKGFAAVTVEQLQKYARVFDVGVADFFQFLVEGKGVNVSVEQSADRLVQHVGTSLAGGRPEEANDEEH